MKAISFKTKMRVGRVLKHGHSALVLLAAGKTVHLMSQGAGNRELLIYSAVTLVGRYQSKIMSTELKSMVEEENEKRRVKRSVAQREEQSARDALDDAELSSSLQHTDIVRVRTVA